MTGSPTRARRWWFAAYLALVLLPIGAAFLFDPLARPRRAVRDVAAAAGFAGLALLFVQFALVSRLGPVARPFGSDVLMRWHRGMGFVALGFVAVHPLLVPDLPWRAWNPFGGPAAWQNGALAFWASALIVATSVWRRRLRLRYEAWQVLHLVAAVVMAAAALRHVAAIDGYARAVPLRWILGAYGSLFAGLLIWYRIVRPIRLYAQPWRITANDDVGGSVRLVRAAPDGHAGFPFEPGQFAWLTTGRSPLIPAQHPLSIASSAEAGPDLEFAIKALGDWSGEVVPRLGPGTRLWIDGPFGANAIEGDRPLVLIAGGIGIAPMRSALRTLADRGDRRPVHLFYAAANWRRVVFRDELERLATVLPLRICWVFEHPDEEWTGERGFVTGDLVARHLAGPPAAFDYFVCGPPRMMESVEGSLSRLGVPAAQVHTERFQVV